ncbi:MAG TPA: sugar ABC transporter permease [Streptosporangiaceae bacterium]|nr:sugar ABC transporter permease [Streptosporangiaceae bacterium]
MTVNEQTIPRSGRARAGGPGGGPASHSLLRQDRRFGYALIFPVLLTLLAITAYPLVYNIWNSFQHDNLSLPFITGFAGLSNYRELFTDHQFVPALVHTIGFTIVSVVLETVIGLAIAVALNKPFRGRGIVRAAVFIPWAVPTVVSAELWRSMFDPQQGFVNFVLTSLHMPLAHTTWLDTTWTAWAAILIADAWRNTPFMAIVLLAGLQVIPSDIYEAARIDGASAWQTFRRLTLPLLKPALMVALIFRTLQSFLVFDVVYIMTGGGPGTSTSVLAYLNWKAFLVATDFGYGGAISVALVIFALVIAGVYTRTFKVEEGTA